MSATRSQLAAAILLLTEAGFVVSKGAPKLAAAPSPSATPPAVTPTMPPAKTADGRAAYTCGECGAVGHNARTCPEKSASKPAPAKAAPAKSSPPPAAPSVDLDSLSFDLGDLGGGVISEPTPAKSASKPAPTVPKSKPAPAPEVPSAAAVDQEIDDILGDLDGLLP